MPLTARLASAGDEALTLAWANDPQTRRNAFNSDTILAVSHHEWFRRRIESPYCSRLYIVQTERGNVPVGQVRFEHEGDAWEIHFSLGKDFRGKGVGKAMVATALAEWQRSLASPTELLGQVKSDNTASKRIFESLGFYVEGNGKRTGTVPYRLEVAQKGQNARHS